MTWENALLTALGGDWKSENVPEYILRMFMNHGCTILFFFEHDFLFMAIGRRHDFILVLLFCFDYLSYIVLSYCGMVTKMMRALQTDTVCSVNVCRQKWKNLTYVWVHLWQSRCFFSSFFLTLCSVDVKESLVFAIVVLKIFREFCTLECNNNNC